MRAAWGSVEVAAMKSSECGTWVRHDKRRRLGARASCAAVSRGWAVLDAILALIAPAAEAPQSRGLRCPVSCAAKGRGSHGVAVRAALLSSSGGGIACEPRVWRWRPGLRATGRGFGDHNEFHGGSGDGRGGQRRRSVLAVAGASAAFEGAGVVVVDVGCEDSGGRRRTGDGAMADVDSIFRARNSLARPAASGQRIPAPRHGPRGTCNGIS